jgi:tetratricopeptide (TPR) repeat protein
MARLPHPPFENSSYVFLIGRAYYDLGETEKAMPFIEEAVRADPQHADASYYLGLLRDDAGDVRGAVEAFLRARALDVMKPPPAWAPSPDAFAQLVRRVIQSLDTLLSRWVRDADVYIVDVPGAELVVDGIDPRATVILDARPPGEDGDAAPLQARLFIYHRNVERGAGSINALESELAQALEREITAVFLDRDGPGGAPSDKHQLN